MFKYKEDELINEILEYIKVTYNQHYVTQNNTQLVDIVDDDELEAFAKISAMKYIQRFGKKAGRNRKDLLKAAHYIVMMLRIDDKKRGAE